MSPQRLHCVMIQRADIIPCDVDREFSDWQFHPACVGGEFLFVRLKEELEPFVAPHIGGDVVAPRPFGGVGGGVGDLGGRAVVGSRACGRPVADDGDVLGVCMMLAPLADGGTELKRYHSCKQLLYCVCGVLADNAQCIRLLNLLSI